MSREGVTTGLCAERHTWRGNCKVVEQLLRLGGGMELGVFGNEPVVKLYIFSSAGSLLVALELALVNVLASRPARPPRPAQVREREPAAHCVRRGAAVHFVEPPPPGSERCAEAQHVDRPRRAHGAPHPRQAPDRNVHGYEP